MKFSALLRRFVPLVLGGWGLLMLTGCVPVISTKIIGSEPPKNLKMYEGDWKVDAGTEDNTAGAEKKNETIRVRINDRAAGHLTVTGPDKDGKPQSIEAYVRTIAGHDFLSLVEPKGKKGTNEFCFMLVVSHGKNTVVVAGPKAETFARLIEAKELHGSTEVNGDKQLKSVTLDGLSEDEVKKLFVPANMDSFYWEHPLVYVRDRS